MGKIIHFEITADDTKRANKFYSEVFDWKISEFMEGYGVADTGDGEGIDGAIMKREFQAQPTTIWIAVDSIEDAMKKVIAAGGSKVNEKQIVENVGEVIYARDTEGNVIGIIKPFPMS